MTRPSRTLAAAVLALGSAALGRALDPATPLTQFGHDVWTSDSGLPQNSVTTILQTRDGYLWLGTQEGLVRFDGVRFTIFDTRNTKTLRDDWVQTLCETADGTLWIGTVTGLARMKNGQFLPAIGPGLGRAQIETLHESRDGSLWVGSEIGVSRIRDGKVTTYAVAQGLPGPRVRRVPRQALSAQVHEPRPASPSDRTFCSTP